MAAKPEKKMPNTSSRRTTVTIEIAPFKPNILVAKHFGTYRGFGMPIA